MDTFIVVIANALELHDDDNGQGVQIFKVRILSVCLLINPNSSLWKIKFS